LGWTRTFAKNNFSDERGREELRTENPTNSGLIF